MIRQPAPEPRWPRRAVLTAAAGVLSLVLALRTRPSAAFANLVADTIIVGAITATLQPLLPMGKRLRIRLRVVFAQHALESAVRSVAVTMQDRLASVAALRKEPVSVPPEFERYYYRYHPFDKSAQLDGAVLELQAIASRSSLQQPFERLDAAMSIEDRYSDALASKFDELVTLPLEHIGKFHFDMDARDMWDWLRAHRDSLGPAQKFAEAPGVASLLTAYVSTAREVQQRCDRMIHILTTEFGPVETALRLAPPPYPRLLARIGLLMGLFACLLWIVAALRPNWFPGGFAADVYDNVETAIVVTFFSVATASVVEQWASGKSAREADKHMLRMSYNEQRAVSAVIGGTPFPERQYIWAEKSDPSREEILARRAEVEDRVEKMQDAAYTLLGARYDALTDALVDGVSRSIRVWNNEMDDLLRNDAVDPFDARARERLFRILLRLKRADDRLTDRLMEVYGPPLAWDREEATTW